MEIDALCYISIYLICIECSWVYANDIEKLTDERKSLNGQVTYSARVLGSQRVSIKDYPYNAFVLGSTKSCGGVIVGKRWILTAAHCKANRNDSFVVWVSLDHENGGNGYPVKKSIQHLLYSDNDIQYDYMLLNLKEELTLTETVKVIPLGEKRDITDGKMLTLTGYGDTIKPFILPCFTCKGIGRDLDLYGVQLRMSTRESCLRMRPKFKNVISVNTFCAGTKEGKASSCSGDSGSPYVSNGVLLGIVTGVRTSKWGCPQTPAIVSSVPYVKTWIELNLLRTN